MAYSQVQQALLDQIQLGKLPSVFDPGRSGGNLSRFLAETGPRTLSLVPGGGFASPRSSIPAVATPETFGITRVDRLPEISNAVRELLNPPAAPGPLASIGRTVGVGGGGITGRASRGGGGTTTLSTADSPGTRYLRSPALGAATDAAARQAQVDASDIRQSAADFVKAFSESLGQQREQTQGDISRINTLTGGAGTVGSVANQLAQIEAANRAAESSNDSYLRRMALGSANRAQLGLGGSSSYIDAATADALSRINIERELARVGRARSDVGTVANLQLGATGRSQSLLNDFVNLYTQPINVRQNVAGSELSRLGALANPTLANIIFQTPEETQGARLSNLSGAANILNSITDFTRPFEPAYLPGSGSTPRLPNYPSPPPNIDPLSNPASLQNIINALRAAGVAGTGNGMPPVQSPVDYRYPYGAQRLAPTTPSGIGSFIDGQLIPNPNSPQAIPLPPPFDLEEELAYLY